MSDVDARKMFTARFNVERERGGKEEEIEEDKADVRGGDMMERMD